MNLFLIYLLPVIVFMGIVVGVSWLYSSGEHLLQVLLICYGFLIGYLAAWFHLGWRHGFRKLLAFLK